MGLFSLFDDQQSAISTYSDYVPSDPPSLDGISTITLDLETNGLYWWRGDRPIGIGLCRPDGSTCYLPFGHKQGRNLDEATVKRWAQQELRHKVITNISTKFDIHHLREWGVDLEAQGCLVQDVAFDAALLDDHRDSFSLESLCQDYLTDDERKVTEVKGMQLDPARMAEYASGAVAVRCEADVRQVHLLQQVFAPRIAEEGLSRVQAVENQCIYAVCEMERNSMHLDVETLHAWNKAVERRTASMLLTVSREVGFSMNPDTSKDWIRLFEKLSIPLVRSKGGTGDPSFTDEILSHIDHPTVQTVRQVGKLMSLRSKYLQSYTKLVESDGRLHYHLHQLRNDDVGTITGRFSSSEVNIQQVPKTKKQTDTKDYLIRQLFVPPPDRLFFSADAKQIEYRIFAHYANSPRINQAFADDPQLNFHQLIFEELKPYSKTLTYEHTKNINFMCVESTTLILRADLRWVSAGELRPGEKVIAFDENQREGNGREKARRWRVAEVLGNELEYRDCYEITLDNGDQLVSTLDHRWLGGTPKRPRDVKWIRTDELRVGDYLPRIGQPWARSDTWEAGWLGGFMDGEGNASQLTLRIAQNPGPVLEFARSTLSKFHSRHRLIDNQAQGIYILGDVIDRMRLLGTVRPERLIRNFVEQLDGKMFQTSEHHKVVSIRSVGPRLIAALGTTAHTYIANGYSAHNTIYGGGLVKLAAMMGFITFADADRLQKERDDWRKAHKYGLPPQPELANALEVQAIYNKQLPEVKPLLDRCKTLAEDRGFIRTMLGRRGRFVTPAHKRFAYKSFNVVGQGGGADYMKVKLIELHQARKQTGFVMRATVHDQVLGDVADAESARLVQDLLDRQSFKLRIPILWDGRTGANWKECD